MRENPNESEDELGEGDQAPREERHGAVDEVRDSVEEQGGDGGEVEEHVDAAEGGAWLLHGACVESWLHLGEC